MSTFRRWAALAWIPLLAWVASAGVAEALYRAAGKRPADDLYGLYEPFGHGGYRHHPHVATTANWASGLYEVYTDELGLRCGQNGRGAVSLGAKLDILFMGDSQAFCQGVNFDDSIAGVLYVRAAQHNRVVANAAVGGHYLRNQLELAQHLHEQQQLHTKTVVVLLTPRMIAGPDCYTRVHVGTDGRLYGDTPGLPVRTRAWLKTHSSIYIALRDAWQGLAEPKDEPPALLAFYETGPAENARREQFTQAMRDVHDWATRAEIKLVLAYAPLAVESEFDTVREAAAALGTRVSADAPWRIATWVGEQLDVPLIDLRPALASVKATGQPVHLRGDAHYSPTLCRACGDAIWAALWTPDLAQDTPRP